MVEFGQVGFHDGTLTSFAFKEGTLTLCIDDAQYQGEPIKVRLVALGAWKGAVKTAEGIPLRMEQEDGEILELSQKESSLVLVVQWNNFKDKRSSYRRYIIPFERISVEAVSGDTGIRAPE